MADERRHLHIFLLPFTAPGHTIPIIDMAKLFASRGVKITIVTTPLNSTFISKSIDNAIQQLTLNFPSTESEEIADSINSPLMLPKLCSAMGLLQHQLEQALLEHRPDCLVADMFCPWTTDAAAKAGIPRLVFHGTSFISLCVLQFMGQHAPHLLTLPDSEPFSFPHLPGEIKFTKTQLFNTAAESSDISMAVTDILKKARDAESRSYGTVVNSFYELERDYADCYRNVIGRKAWHIGPLFLHNKVESDDKLQRGAESAIDEVMKWLDSKKPSSVVYICFGSMVKFSSAQLREIANGLEASGQEFIWVVRRGNEEDDEESWLPEGFERRMEGKGKIMRGWAPQVVILNHAAAGAFVSHCGWNSTLEAVAAGVPMVTWPIYAEQFYNEKLVIEVLKSGVGVGVQKWVGHEGEVIGREAIGRAITEVMVGDESEKMRSRAKELAELARKAVAEDGSSYSDLNALIEELKSLNP